MQLKLPRCVYLASSRARLRRGLCTVAAVAELLLAANVRAQVADVEVSSGAYFEAPPRTSMFVLTPGLVVGVRPAPWLRVLAGYEADVVSGSSASVKAGAAYQRANAAADVISLASVRDVRHRGNFGAEVAHGDVTLALGAAYSTEKDYHSLSADIAVRTEAYAHNTQLELSYAKSLDGVCDRAQSSADSAPRFRALENSVGCFTADTTRTTRDVTIDGFQASWSQAWAPRLVTQLVYSAQIVDGFQSNPYRSVVVGQGVKAQEHQPDLRARHALALRGNYYLRPLKVALRAGVRAYADSWGIRSGTVELEVDRAFSETIRASLRGRGYRQSGALFFSDDYTGGEPPLGPKGQYFTGDRELSPFFSVLIGARLTYAKQRQAEPLLGVLDELRATISVDAMQFHYDEFTLGGQPLHAARALLLGGSVYFAF